MIEIVVKIFPAYPISVVDRINGPYTRHGPEMMENIGNLEDLSKICG